MNTRRDFFRRSLASVAGVASPAPADSGRPNLLLVLTDQQFNGAMSSAGNRYLSTPAMDSLARDGVSFAASYCTYPLCSPARSSIFTGRMPHETGVRNNALGIARGIPNLGETFREAGYRTAYAGKWHLPAGFGPANGFDQIHGAPGPGSRTDAPLASRSVEYLMSEPRQPFLLVASFMNPHDISGWIRANQGTRAHPEPVSYPPAPANMAIDPDEPEYMQYHRNSTYNLCSIEVGIASHWMRDDWRQYLHAYYRFVEAVDVQIGRVLSALNRSGLYRNTVVVFTADHGEGMGAHRWVEKAAFWEQTARVPFIVAGAGVTRRGIRDEKTLVSGLDAVPTLCDYAGIPAPAHVRGRSLRQAVDGGSLDRTFVVSEISEYGKETPEAKKSPASVTPPADLAARQGRMVRTERYKYVVFNGGRRPEQLFDLQLDPGEVHNLARRPEAASTIQQHRRLLLGWMQATKDDFTMPAELPH